MLRLLFQSLEQSLGPALAPIALVIYWSGLMLLALVVLVPMYRLRMYYKTARLGMVQQWVVSCQNCDKLTLVSGRYCGFCDHDLNIPWTVRAWTSSSGWIESKAARLFMWISHGLGIVSFVALSAWLVSSSGALAPQGELHRFFVGLGLLAWAAVGRFGGRTIRIGRRGILARVGDALTALAAVGVLAMALFLADAARPTPVQILATFDTAGGKAQIGDQVLALSEGEIGFEYLQLDHELLGYHRIIPLAFKGNDRLPLPKHGMEQLVISHLRKYAGGYTRRGLTVRLRTDRLQTGPGQSYEVIQRDGQVLIRKAGEGRAGS
jgi:hypothetical protein